MKTTTAWVAIAVSILASVAAACGGDSSPSDGGSDATTGGDATTDAPVTDAPATDGETKPDGCVPIDGGLACDPGHVACGSAACDLTTQFCCIADAGAGNTCTNYPPDSGPPPKNNCTGETKVLCDEAADCPSGQVCCGFVGATGGFATSCSTSCGTGIQFCHGSAECVTGTCTAQQCRGENIETCTTLCP